LKALLSKAIKKIHQLHAPDGKKRCGAYAASLDGPLVMQVVNQAAARLD
jgi:hypothetical protein